MKSKDWYIIKSNRDIISLRGTLIIPNERGDFMNTMIDLQRKIVPEIFPILEKRYNILKNIDALGPIGRRNLAIKLSMGERIVRAEVDLLKELGLVEINAVGMKITEEGKELLQDLTEVMYSIDGMDRIEEELQRKLQIKKVIIVPGNVEEDGILKNIGKATAKLIESSITENTKIGITGGNTMAAVAEELTQHTKKQNITVYPARGGLGKQVEIQANTIAAKMASKLNGNYELLHASDTLSSQTMEILLKDKEIKEVIENIKSVDLLIFGIGRADTMANRREFSKEIIEKLEESKAVSEAFGYYFNQHGDIVYETNSMGIKLEDFHKIKEVIGVAGGKDKAEAIGAICSLRKSMILVIDEAAAKELLQLN